MNQSLLKSVPRKKIYLSLFSLSLFLSVSATCYAADPCASYSGNEKSICQLKNYTTVSVVTTDRPGGWYNDKDNTLHKALLCDDRKGKDDSYNPFSTAPAICDGNGEHDNYYSSDSLENDLNINTAYQNFTIKVNTSNSVYGMAKVEIQWLSGKNVNPPSSWNGATSQVCSGSGSCEVCRKGGQCAHPVIDTSDLSTRSNGDQNVLWFRVIVTDNASKPNNITTGWDENTSVKPVLDKMYRFPICNRSGCSKTCDSNDVPTISGTSTDGSQCAAGKPYTFNWNLKSHDGQSEFIIEVNDKATGKLVYSTDQVSSGTSFTPAGLFVGAGGQLEAGKTYTWRLRVKDNAGDIKEQDCKKWSAWLDGKEFTTCGSGTTTPTTGVCNPVNDAPSAATIKAEDSMHDPCNGFRYTLTWSFADTNNQKQSAFELNIRKYGTTSPIYNTGKILSSTNHLTLFDDILKKMKLNLDYGNTYEWQVKVYDNDPREECVKDSGWSAWTGANAAKSIKMPDTQYPQVVFSVKNDSGADCTSVDGAAGACHTMENITFADNSTVFPSGSTKSYEWYLDDSTTSASSNASFNRSYLPSDGANHKVTLKVTDQNKHTCTKSRDFIFGQAKPVWNEVSPK